MTNNTLIMKYLDPKDYDTFSDEITGDKVNLILMSGIRKIIKKEAITYTLSLEDIKPMTSKGKESMHIIVKCTARNKTGEIETYASASPNTTPSHYVIEMAEKRAIGRAVLMLVGIYDKYKGADEFSAQEKPLSIPKL
jgi:hypothetical protein